MKRIFAGWSWFLAMITGVGAVLGAQHTKDTLKEVKEGVMTKKAVLVDVREQAEWNRGHLEGAVLIPLSELQEWKSIGLDPARRARLDKAIPKGAIVYCHCAAGGRSVPAGEILRGFGYDARALREGYRDLVKAGFPRSPK